jgi:hypothetical protein
MNRARTFILILTVIGLAFSSWQARPASSYSLSGWSFSVFWSSLAWCLLVILSTLAAHPARLHLAVGGFIALGASELLVFAFARDPLLLAIKPAYQVPLATVGVIFGFFWQKSNAKNA